MKASTDELKYAALVRKADGVALRHRLVRTSVEVEVVAVSGSDVEPVIEFDEPGPGRVTAYGWNGRLYLPAEEGRWIASEEPGRPAIDEGDPAYVIVSHDKGRALAHARDSLIEFRGTTWAACPHPRVIVPDCGRGIPLARDRAAVRVSMDPHYVETVALGLDPERARKSLRLVHRREQVEFPAFRVRRPDLLWDTGEVRDLWVVGRLVAEAMRKDGGDLEAGHWQAVSALEEAVRAWRRDPWEDHVSWHRNGTAMRAALARCVGMADGLTKPLRAAAEFAVTDCPGLDAPPPEPADVLADEDVAAVASM